MQCLRRGLGFQEFQNIVWILSSNPEVYGLHLLQPFNLPVTWNPEYPTPSPPGSISVGGLGVKPTGWPLMPA